MSAVTVSRDGRYRIDLRISFRVTLDDLARVLATTAEDDDLDSVTPLSVADIRDRIRNQLHRQGRDLLIGWADHIEDAERDAVLDWARQQIRRAYPELATTA